MSDLLDRRYFTPGAVVFYLAVGFMGFYLAQEVNDAFDRTPPIEYLTRSVGELTVERGGTFQVSYLLKRTRQCVSYPDRIVEDSKGVMTPVVLQSGTVSSKTLGLHREERTVTLPDTDAISTGPARYRVQFKSYCSVLQRLFDAPIVFSSPDVRINIVDKTMPGFSRMFSGYIETFNGEIETSKGEIEEVTYCPLDKPILVRSHHRYISDIPAIHVKSHCRS